MDPGMNQLLKWSIENASSTETSDPQAPTARPPPNPEALNALFGGPSDADLMKQSMTAILSPQTTLPDKLVAFDNLEQLIETIDNANNLEPLGLWTPLVSLLSAEEAELRRMAAWCVGTAVQNNVKAQERLLVLGAIPVLVGLAVGDGESGVRRKAVYALSSEVRNYQPGFEELVRALPEGMRPGRKVDAGDMEPIDRIMDQLRTHGSAVTTS